MVDVLYNFLVKKFIEKRGGNMFEDKSFSHGEFRKFLSLSYRIPPPVQKQVIQGMRECGLISVSKKSIIILKK